MPPTTRINLLRGADTIGGSCIRICHGDDSIILDYGMPLMASGGDRLDEGAVLSPNIDNGILLDVTADDTRPLAFIISHAHPDHYGLVDHVPDDIPVYISGAAKALMEVGNVFYPPAMQLKRLASCEIYTPWQSFTVGPFTITAHLMDHSAFGACSLLVEVAGKRIFYTGDFRGHGRKASMLDAVIKAVPEPDVLLMEGTTLDDGHPATFPDEASVEEALVALCRKTVEPIFVAGSGSNVDRLVSLYRAAKRSRRILVLDLYQAYLLDSLKHFSPGLPPHDNDCLRVFYPRHQCTALVEAVGEQALYRFKHRQIRADDIGVNSTRYVFRLSNGITRRLCLQFLKKGTLPQLVYSMWQGYQQRQPSFAHIEALTGRQWQYIHTSGHAYSHDLKRLAEATRPKYLVPIHTLRGDEFEQHFSNVVRLGNGDTLDLGA